MGQSELILTVLQAISAAADEREERGHQDCGKEVLSRASQVDCCVALRFIRIIALSFFTAT